MHCVTAPTRTYVRERLGWRQSAREREHARLIKVLVQALRMDQGSASEGFPHQLERPAHLERRRDASLCEFAQVVGQVDRFGLVGGLHGGSSGRNRIGVVHRPAMCSV